jgi:20S proteasome subunit alpha 7
MQVLAERLSLYLNSHTLYGSVRAFGSTEIIAAHDEFDGLSLFMIEPAGVFYGYTCCTAGKGRQVAKSEFEKRDFAKMTCK